MANGVTTHRNPSTALIRLDKLIHYYAATNKLSVLNIEFKGPIKCQRKRIQENDKWCVNKM